MELNPHSFRRIVGTLLEVNGRGYWETSDENIEQLKEELGDLLLQVVFHSRIAEELGKFNFFEVASGISEKMIIFNAHYVCVALILSISWGCL